MTKPIQDSRRVFIEKIGIIAQNDDLPRIPGRVPGLLVWDEKAITFDDLATQMQFSQGSVRTATRILEERRLIRRRSGPGQRPDHFRLAESPYARKPETQVVRLFRAGLRLS